MNPRKRAEKLVISIEPPLKGVCNTWWIGAHDGNKIKPLVYIKRAKYCDDKEFASLIQHWKKS